MAKRWAEMSEEERQRARERSARYRERNRERIRAAYREKYAANTESILARRRKLYAEKKAEDPDKHRAMLRKKYERGGRECSLAWIRANPERAAAASAKWREENPVRIRELHLRGKFGIGIADYEQMLRAQGGVCAICERQERRVDARTGKPRRLAVDHCHESEKVRGLLCFSCNTAIGQFDHKPEIAAAAHRYLSRWAMRGRLVFAFAAELHRLDTHAMVAPDSDGGEAIGAGYDTDFKEPRLVDHDDDGIGERVRAEHPAVRVPCQIDTKAFEELRMFASGNAPRSRIDLLFHFKDLERLGLVDAATGDALVRPGDRLGAIYDKAGALVQAIRTSPGLYVTEARPSGFGLNMARPRRNLLTASFEDRQPAARRVA